MQLRDNNPLSAELQGSICHFSFESDLIKTAFDISHAKIDAFGGMAMATKIYQAIGSPALRPTSEVRGTIDGEFQFSQWTAHSASQGRGEKSFSQRFLEKAVPLFAHHGISSLALPVRLDVLEQPLENVWGNSFIIVELQLQGLSEMLSLSKVEWAKALYERALRTLEVSKRRAKRPLASPVLISLVGDISKLQWSSAAFTPQTFRMIPTPRDVASSNLVLWSRADDFAFVHCAHRSREDAWLQPLLNTWRGMFS